MRGLLGHDGPAVNGGSRPLSFTTEPPPPAHISGVFETDFERRSALRRFFRVGLIAGERCAINIDADDPANTLSAIGTDAEVTQWREEGLLTVLRAPTGSADDVTIQEMLDVWDSFIDRARHTPTRIGGEATWWLHVVTADKLLEYERELELSMPPRLSALCLYDRNRFDSDALRIAMQIHPQKVSASRRFVDNDAYCL